MGIKKMSKKKMKRILLISLAICLLIGAASYTLFIKPALEKEELVYKENTAAFGKLQKGVTESGTIEFEETTQLYDLDISTEDDSDDDDDDDDDEEEEKYLRIEKVFVAAGQRIQEGDAIYQFTKASVEDVRKALQHYKTEKEIVLAQAQSEYEVGILTAGLTYEETMLGSGLAEATYRNTVAQLQTQMTSKSLEIENMMSEILNLQLSLIDEDYIEQKEDIVESYEDALEDLEEDLEDFFTNSITSQVAFKNAKSSYDEFFAQMDETNEEIQDKVEEVLELQEELDRTRLLLQKELLLAEQAQDTSVTGSKIADSKYQSDIRSYQKSVDTAQEELEEATKKLEAFDAFVGEGTIYASGSGLVTAVGYEEDDKLKTEGILISYVQSDAMKVSVDVSQEDVVDITVGEKVQISFTAYEDEVYEGVVQSITTTATSEDSPTVSYPVIISIQGDTSKLYGGMTADVTFVMEESEETTYISRKAIVEEDGKQYVYQKSGGQYILTPIQTGFSDGIYVEVTDGLQAGDTYYIAMPVVKDSSVTEESEDKNRDVQAQEAGEWNRDAKMPEAEGRNGDEQVEETGGKNETIHAKE